MRSAGQERGGLGRLRVHQTVGGHGGCCEAVERCRDDGRGTALTHRALGAHLADGVQRRLVHQDGLVDGVHVLRMVLGRLRVAAEPASGPRGVVHHNLVEHVACQLLLHNSRDLQAAQECVVEYRDAQRIEQHEHRSEPDVRVVLGGPTALVQSYGEVFHAVQVLAHEHACGHGAHRDVHQKGGQEDGLQHAILKDFHVLASHEHRGQVEQHRQEAKEGQRGAHPDHPGAVEAQILHRTPQGRQAG
mmetsp:Transcript_47587/g.90832  ORF Transcript_47587/g.90832 Transcript_47587/m.90832 type:complete len:246 (+) Transcript_47587:1313-2050(+)